MPRAKKSKKTNKATGRDAHGNPVPLRSMSVTRARFSNPKDAAQRKGDAKKGSMGEEEKRQRRSK